MFYLFLFISLSLSTVGLIYFVLYVGFNGKEITRSFANKVDSLISCDTTQEHIKRAELITLLGVAKDFGFHDQFSKISNYLTKNES